MGHSSHQPDRRGAMNSVVSSMPRRSAADAIASTTCRSRAFSSSSHGQCCTTLRIHRPTMREGRPESAYCVRGACPWAQVRRAQPHSRFPTRSLARHAHGHKLVSRPLHRLQHTSRKWPRSRRRSVSMRQSSYFVGCHRCHASRKEVPDADAREQFRVCNATSDHVSGAAGASAACAFKVAYRAPCGP
jgi:hypothetical protein